MGRAKSVARFRLSFSPFALLDCIFEQYMVKMFIAQLFFLAGVCFGDALVVDVDNPTLLLTDPTLPATNETILVVYNKSGFKPVLLDVSGLNINHIVSDSNLIF